MALNKSPLLIRDYDNIRQLLRDIYIFGCFSRDDYIEKKGISGRKYDNEQRRINAYLPGKFISKRRAGKKVIQYCRYDLEDKFGNYLVETYRNKSFTMLDIMSYFFVMQILSDEKERTLSEILDDIPACNDDVEFTKDNLRLKLEELAAIGLIKTRKDGRNVLYCLGDDIFKGLSSDELLDLYMYLEFLRNTSPVDVPFYFLQRKLKLYLAAERKIEAEDVNVFKFRQNHLFNSLDNDVILLCLQALHNKKVVTIERVNGKFNNEVLPVSVIHDSTYGRQYMIYLDKQYQSVSSVRIDAIKGITLLRDMTGEEKELLQEKSDMYAESWSTSCGKDGHQEIVIHFLFDEKKEDYILNRIKREGHGGTVTRIEANLYEYRKLINDPNEMIPWIRSFGERARVISSGDAKTEEKIAEDWERAVSKYESISRNRE